MIVDCHTHLNTYEEAVPTPLEARVERLLTSMERNGIDHSLVLTSYRVDAHRPSITQVVEATRPYRARLSVVAGLSYVNYKHYDLREISEYLDASELVGLKLYPGYEPFYPADQRCQVIYDLAAEYGVPVMLHCGDTYHPRAKVRYAHPLNVDEVAVDHPDVRFVICHLGNPWIRDTMEVIYKNANVYTDISGLVLGDFEAAFERYMRNQIREVLLYAGDAGRVMFGTDWPLATMDGYREFMKDLKLRAAEREMILWQNAARLFRLDLGVAVPADPSRHNSVPPMGPLPGDGRGSERAASR